MVDVVRAQQTWLDVGQIGAIRLGIPIYTVGSDKPTFAITCSVHGDEHAGLYMAARVLDRVKEPAELSGTIHVIVAANPAAQFLSSRIGPLDHKDLNRLGTGRASGSVTERTAARLFAFLSECDFVINVHEFEMHTPVTVTLIDAGSSDTRAKTLDAARVFDPDVFWVIKSAQPADAQYSATLDAALAVNGTANFAIETTQLAFLTGDEIQRVADGIIRVASHLGILGPADTETRSNLGRWRPYRDDASTEPGVRRRTRPAFTREEVTAEAAGLWEPGRETLMTKIGHGRRVGTLIELPDFEKRKVASRSAGVLLQRRHRQLVSTGTSLFSVGHRADDIVANYVGE